MKLAQPVEEIPRVVEGNLDSRVRSECIDHRQVAVPVELLEDPVEVAHRLVVVKRQGEAQALHPGEDTDYPLPFMSGAGFEGVAGHRRVLSVLESQLQADHLAHAYLLTREAQL